MSDVLHLPRRRSTEPSFSRPESLFEPQRDLKADHLANLDRFKNGRAADPLAFYARFPTKWQAFLNDNFRNYHGDDRIEAVALFFSVTEKCAEKWLGGKGGCNGDKLAYALSNIDGAAEQLLYAAE